MGPAESSRALRSEEFWRCLLQDCCTTYRKPVARPVQWNNRPTPPEVTTSEKVNGVARRLLLLSPTDRHIIDDVALADPSEFVPLATDLWRAMDEGKRFLLRKLLRFNGHFFKDATALPLTREALALLLTASQADWQHVEPTIFGTLLTRALDPRERHRLGAEYTPREFVERVVRPAVEEPVRTRWTAVQAEVLQLRESGRKRDSTLAAQRLRDFHEWLRGLQFLDPAYGSGNFLYVTMHLVKRIELEVIRALEEVTGEHEIRLAEVGPWQFQDQRGRVRKDRGVRCVGQRRGHVCDYQIKAD